MPFLDLFLMLSPAYYQTNATLAEHERLFTGISYGHGIHSTGWGWGVAQAQMKTQRESERDQRFRMLGRSRAKGLWFALVQTSWSLFFEGRHIYLIRSGQQIQVIIFLSPKIYEFGFSLLTPYSKTSSPLCLSLINSIIHVFVHLFIHEVFIECLIYNQPFNSGTEDMESTQEEQYRAVVRT